MSYNNEGSQPVVVDIETVAIDEAAQYLEPATAPANYRDPEKIAAYIANAQAKAVDRAALDLDLCRIVALGYVCQGDYVAVHTCADKDIERSILEAFWPWVGEKPLLGFNCLAFDVPILLRRSLYLGVAVPPLVLDKYRHPSIIDLMQLLSFNGLVPPRSLAFYCRRFGLEVPDDPVTGADIARLVASEDWPAVERHCRSDVKKTRELARRMGVM